MKGVKRGRSDAEVNASTSVWWGSASRKPSVDLFLVASLSVVGQRSSQATHLPVGVPAGQRRMARPELHSDGCCGSSRRHAHILRGGAASADHRVVVSTTKISSYVDQKTEVSLPADSTISALKEQLAKKFPGKPPVTLQRLFKGTELLSDERSIASVAEDIPGPLPLLLDMPPPVDLERFDPDTVVPAKREGQLEAFCSNLAAHHQMTSALFQTMRGEEAFGGQDAGQMGTSLALKTDHEAALEFLKRTLREVPEPAPVDEAKTGPIHEFFRPLARQFDIDWANTIRLAAYLWLCANFGAEGRLREVMSMLLIPTVFVYQTRWAKVVRKILWNIVPVVPGLAELITALLPAPEQVLLNLKEQEYVQALYGPAGPKYDPAYVEAMHQTDDPAPPIADHDGSSDLLTSDDDM